MLKSIRLMSAIATTSKYKESESRQRRHFSTVHSISSTLANFLSTLTRQQLFEVHYSLHWLNSRWKETVRSSEMAMSATANAASKHGWQSSRNARSLILMSFYKKIGFAQKERKMWWCFPKWECLPWEKIGQKSSLLLLRKWVIKQREIIVTCSPNKRKVLLAA